MSKIDDLVNKLEQEAGKAPKGVLYHAVKIVADEQRKNADNFLSSSSITANDSLNKDRNTFINKFGFHNKFLKTFIVNSVSFQFVSKEIYEYFLLVAYFIVSSDFDLKAEPKQDTEKTTTEPQEQPAFKNLTLALILNGKETKDIAQAETPLDLEQVKDLLDKASYFLCTSQQEMSEIQTKLTLDNREIDHDSEQQQVFVPIQFKQDKPLKTFATKLELTHYIRHGSSEFKIETMQCLAQITGLTKRGFIRT
ncbi:MAG: hypothetical protein ABFS56_06930 [Pseudomonadota bacterium]